MPGSVSLQVLGSSKGVEGLLQSVDSVVEEKIVEGLRVELESLADCVYHSPYFLCMNLCFSPLLAVGPGLLASSTGSLSSRALLNLLLPTAPSRASCGAVNRSR